MNRENGEMRYVSSVLETVTAAATAINAAEAPARPPMPSVQKRRWVSFFSIYWCFGYQKQSKRIGHAVLVPDQMPEGPTTSAQNPTQIPPITLPFVAPPSSPVSLLPSELPSAAHSPTVLVSLKSCASICEPRSIFAIGPYAYETQLVSPPVFSTEPSTAPYTPPPESLHLTTPSSPEVPFAQLLNPIQAYQFQPGSPVGPLISPGSAFSSSGTSSPYFHDIRYGVPPKLLTPAFGPTRELGSQQGSLGSLPSLV